MVTPLIPEENLSEPTPPDIPKQIGRYKIECLLQRGGMSSIYLGTDPSTNEAVAIKSLLPKFLLQKDVVERFKREAKIISLTNHPNIVKMHSQGEWEGGPFIAMEFIIGISLRQHILQTHISLKKGLEAILDISYALCHLHAHGIIHRDLKPENIIISDTGKIKLIDFGIAQLISDEGSTTHPEGHRMIGTPIYMSPEQRENPEGVSYPADIYSLGIIAYEVVLGRLSHGQLHLSLMPKGLQKILNKALQPDPINRYQDVVDLISDISSYMTSNNFQKEGRPGDHLSILSEEFRIAQKTILAPSPPEWPEFKIGLAVDSGMELTDIYTEFLKLSPSRYAILMGKSMHKGAQGILESAMVRGIVNTLVSSNISPEELIKKINHVICSSLPALHFAICCLIIDLQHSELQFISCGCGALWHFLNKEAAPQQIISKNPVLGIRINYDFNETSAPWQVGNQLLIYDLFTEDAQQKNDIESLLLHGLIEFADLPSSKQVNALLRKIKLSLAPDASKSILIKIERVKNHLAGN